MLKNHQRLLIMFLVGWPVLSLLVHGGRIEHWIEWGAVLSEIVGRMALWAVVGAALAVPMWAAWNRWFSRDPRPAVQLAALIGLCLIAGLTFAGLTEFSNWPLPERQRGRDRQGPPFWARAVTPILAMYAWAAVQFTLDAYRHLARERERTLEAEALAAEARLTMLRYELNPHFLFNAMNSIIGVIDEEPSRAQEMIRQLAGLLRYTLHSPPESTLGAELEVARKYLAIEQVRFEERLTVELDVPAALAGSPAPSMLLQPLVENAVKHGMGAGQLTVRIEAERLDGALVIRVSNQGQLKDSGEGVGLRNLRERLRTHPSGGHFEIEQRGELVVATVTLSLEES